MVQGKWIKAPEALLSFLGVGNNKAIAEDNSFSNDSPTRLLILWIF